MSAEKHVTVKEDGTIRLNRAVTARHKKRVAAGKKLAKLAPHRPPKFSKKQVAEALRKAGGFKSRACKILNCKYDTLQRYFVRYPDLHQVLKEIESQYCDMAEYSLLKQIRKENPQSTMYYLSRKGKDRGYADPKDQAATAQFNQFNLGIPGGGTWLDLMEKAHKDLLQKGQPTVIDLAPSKPVALVTDGKEEE